jgi:hypothetical protein
MSRKRSLSSLLFRTARTVDDVEALASGNPKRIERRAKNRIIGRGTGTGGRVAATLAMMPPASTKPEGGPGRGPGDAGSGSEPQSVVAPDRMARYTWHHLDDIDMLPRSVLGRVAWRHSWPVRAWWRRMRKRLSG